MATSGIGGNGSGMLLYGVTIRDRIKSADLATLQAYHTVAQDLLKTGDGDDGHHATRLATSKPRSQPRSKAPLRARIRRDNGVRSRRGSDTANARRQTMQEPALEAPVPGQPPLEQRVPEDDPRRRLSLRDQIDCVPVYVVWEITLACNLKCIHCGSRAGHRRARELTTDEAIDVVRQLAELGTREISIIGGEAFVRRDWLTIVRAIRDHGMDCTMQTGGYKLSRDMISQAAEAGLLGLGVSVDGLQPLHDRLRGVPGSSGKPCAFWTTAGASAGRQRQHPDHVDRDAAASRGDGCHHRGRRKILAGPAHRGDGQRRRP